MTGHGCTSRCGFCGFCSTEADLDARDEDRPVFCGSCNKDISGPYDYKLSLAFGTFCSTACADQEELKFTARLPQRQSRKAS